MAIDVSQASVARMYDYLLGGTDNYDADRVACQELLALAPDTQQIALINRQFLIRAVRYLADDCGIGQFLDHGSGLPTQDNVHQVAQRLRRGARVAYVDNDPIVLAHARMMLEENRQTTVIEADMLQTDRILSICRQRGLYDQEEPTAALFVSVLHCVPDDRNPWDAVRELIGKLPSGSYLALCHLASDDVSFRDEVTKLMARVTGGKWGRVRSFEEVDRFFEGLEIVDGLCDVSRWKNDIDIAPRADEGRWIEYGGLARIP